MESVLVTGGAGYVGSVVTETLCKSGFPVVVVDDLRDSEKKSFHMGQFFTNRILGMPMRCVGLSTNMAFQL